MSTQTVNQSYGVHQLDNRVGAPQTLESYYDSLEIGSVIKIAPSRKTEVMQKSMASKQSKASTTPLPLTAIFQASGFSIAPHSPPDFELVGPTRDHTRHFLVLLGKGKVQDPSGRADSVISLLYLGLTASGELEAGGQPITYEPSNLRANRDATREHLWHRLGAVTTPLSLACPHSKGFNYLRNTMAGELGLMPKETFIVGPMEAFYSGSTQMQPTTLELPLEMLSGILSYSNAIFCADSYTARQRRILAVLSDILDKLELEGGGSDSNGGGFGNSAPLDPALEVFDFANRADPNFFQRISTLMEAQHREEEREHNEHPWRSYLDDSESEEEGFTRVKNWLSNGNLDEA